MKYYVIQSSNGTVSVVSEWSDLNSAIVAYHDRCKILWNATRPKYTETTLLQTYATKTVSEIINQSSYSRTVSHYEFMTTDYGMVPYSTKTFTTKDVCKVEPWIEFDKYICDGMEEFSWDYETLMKTKEIK